MNKENKVQMFKWVHLSDLHFQSKESYGIERAREKLSDYLQRKVKNCDAVFLTGDFRFAKNSQGDIEKIASFITEIKDSVQARHIICVPGNHDLKRSVVRTAIIDGVLKDYSPERNSSFDEGMLELLKKDFSFYDDLAKKLNLTYSDAQKENVHEVIEIEECNLLLLNTAITAGKDDERGSLVMGIDSVKRAFEKVNHEKPLIVLGHHGASFWNREEQKILFDLFEQEKVKLYLCGHEHILYNEHIGNNAIMQITTGCMESTTGDNQVDIGFCVGNLDSEGKAHFNFHSWNNSSKSWAEIDKRIDDIFLMQPKKKNSKKNDENILKENIMEVEYPSAERHEYQFTLNGHTLLGSRGMYGIRYYWKKGEDSVESLAFNQRLCEPIGEVIKDQENQQISAYTVSVSFGCVLSAHLSQCRFCETGSRSFKGFLSAEEIAMQNIFMATYDSACPSYPEVRTHKREFSFMGQGEPGYNYPAIREAIRITDIAMDKLNQEIYRYNISTSGISDFIPMLIADIKAGIFHNPVTLHYSLHAIGNDRNRLMPINANYDYNRFIKSCEKLYEVNNKKIGIGLLMFKNFKPVKRGGESEFASYTLTKNNLNEILNILNPEIFSIDLCDLNKTSLIDEQEEVSNEEALELLKIAKDRGFEAKIFSSFASEQKAGCGMLSSEYLDASIDGEKTREQYSKSLELLNYSVYKLKMED